MRLLLLSVFVLFSTEVWAQDDSGSLILSLAGVVNTTVEEVGDDQEDDQLNVGGGVLVEAAVNDAFGIETGALYLRRQYEVSEGNARLVQEVGRVHVPVLARLWPVDYFSIAAGPFVAFAVTDEETQLEIGDTEVAQIETAASNSAEFGLDAAATFNFAVNDKTGFFLEGRYSVLLGEAANEDADELSALAGLKFDI